MMFKLDLPLGYSYVPIASSTEAATVLVMLGAPGLCGLVAALMEANAGIAVWPLSPSRLRISCRFARGTIAWVPGNPEVAIVDVRRQPRCKSPSLWEMPRDVAVLALAGTGSVLCGLGAGVLAMCLAWRCEGPPAAPHCRSYGQPGSAPGRGT